MLSKQIVKQIDDYIGVYVHVHIPALLILSFMTIDPYTVMRTACLMVDISV